MNDYREILPFLKRELARLENGRFNLSTEQILDVMSSNGSDMADVAIREYASTLLWPVVPDCVRFEISLRFRVAIWWIETLHDTSCEGDELHLFLTETMIDYWRDVGRTDWLYNHLVVSGACSTY